MRLKTKSMETKHKITIVKFMAFDREQEEHFIDMEWEDVLDALFVRCSTFDLLSHKVYECVVKEFVNHKIKVV